MPTEPGQFCMRCGNKSAKSFEGEYTVYRCHAHGEQGRFRTPAPQPDGSDLVDARTDSVAETASASVARTGKEASQEQGENLSNDQSPDLVTGVEKSRLLTIDELDELLNRNRWTFAKLLAKHGLTMARIVPIETVRAAMDVRTTNTVQPTPAQAPAAESAPAAEPENAPQPAAHEPEAPAAESAPAAEPQPAAEQ